MVRVDSINVKGHTFTGITVELPRTRLVVLAGRRGYLMCGALDVGLLNDRLAERRIAAARCLGVRTYQDLLDQPVESATDAARDLGVLPGMSGSDALLKMA